MKRITLTLLIILASIVSFASDYKIIKSDTGSEISFTQLVEELKIQDVVFFGELHDDSLLHAIENDLFKQLTLVEPNFVLGMESFARNDQFALNNYLSGNYSFEQLDANSNLWSNYTDAYAGLIDYSKNNNIEVLATNVPIYISGLVAREGLSALKKLSEKERSFYARQIKPFDNDYKDMFLEEMSQITKGSSDQVNSMILERLYHGQTIKDDTMAETVFDYLEDNHKAKIFHVNGDFHSKNHYGIYQKLELLNPHLEIASISPITFPQGESLIWDYRMFGQSDYVIMYNREEESTILNDKADSSEFLTIDKHNISFIFEPSQQVLTVSDKITFNLKQKDNKLLISKDIKELEITSGQERVGYILTEFNDKFNQIEVKTSAKEINFVYIYDYPKDSKRPYYFHLEEYMWHPVATLGEKSLYEVNALGPDKMKFIAPAEVTITPSKRDAIYYSWKSFGEEQGFSIIGGIYFTKSLEVDNALITLYSFKEEFELLEDYSYFTEQYFNSYKQYFGNFGYDSFSIIQSADNNYKSFDNMLLVNNNVFKAKDIFISPGVLGHDLAKVWINSKCQWNQSGANWQEMIANFVANYIWLANNKPEEAYLWRKDALEDISAIPKAEIKAIENFKFPKDKYSAVNGFKIGGMLFYYAYNKVGDSAFFTSLREILSANDNLSGEEFFTSLQNKTGAKELKSFIDDIYPVRVFIKEAQVKGEMTRIKIISSKGAKSNFDLDIKLSNKDNFINTTYHIDKKETILEFKFEATEVEIDKDYKLYRYLDNRENVFNLKRTFLENPLLLVPQENDKFSEIYNIGNTLRSNGVAVDMMPLSSINDFEWRTKSVLYVGEYNNNPVFNAFQPYLPPSFIFGKNKFTYEGKTYNKDNQSLILNTKNPFTDDKSVSMWLWNSDKRIDNIPTIFNYTTPSWVILEYDGEEFIEVAKGNLVDENLFPTKVKILGRK